VEGGGGNLARWMRTAHQKDINPSREGGGGGTGGSGG